MRQPHLSRPNERLRQSPPVVLIVEKKDQGLDVMGRAVTKLAVAATIWALTAVAAAAQTAGGSCDEQPSDTYAYSRQNVACARSIVGRHQLIYVSDIIQRVVGNSFGRLNSQVAPAGLEDLTAEEALARLVGGPVTVIETAGEPTAAVASPLWNVWGDAKYTWNDSSPSVLDLDGPMWNAMAGFDYKLNDSVTIGLLGSFETSHLKGAGFVPPDIDSQGWGAGPYLGIILSDHLIFAGNVLASQINSDQNGIFDFDSFRLQASAGITGYWYNGTWRYSPGLTLAWSKEWLDENGGLANDQINETVVLTPSFQIGNTMALGATSTVEPWLGVNLDWTLVNRSEDEVFGTLIDDPNVDLRLQAGLNFGLATNVQLAIIGEAAGLLLDTTDSYAGEINLAIQF